VNVTYMNVVIQQRRVIFIKLISTSQHTHNSSVVTVTETETAVVVQNRTEPKPTVLGGLLAGSVLKSHLCVTPVYSV